MALKAKCALLCAMLALSNISSAEESLSESHSRERAMVSTVTWAADIASRLAEAAQPSRDVSKATTLVTLIDARSNLCIQNYPLEAKNLGFDFSVADIAAGLFTVLDVKVKCLAIGFPVYTGYLLGTNLTSGIYALDTPSGLAFCRRGLVENCTLAIPRGNSFTVISQVGDQCYEAVNVAALAAFQGNPAFSVYDAGVSCKSLGMEILVGFLSGTRLSVPVYSSSESTGRILCNSGAVEGCALPNTTSSGNAIVTVREFYNAGLNRYFRTADPREISDLSATPASGETLTDDTFLAYSSQVTRSAPVCRFYGSVKPGPNGHFYTLDQNECAGLKGAQQSTPSSTKRWNFEAIAFYAFEPVAGACPAGTSTPIYRAYNRGNVTGRDSNHRFTANVANYNAMLAQGWLGEGVVMCAP